MITKMPLVTECVVGSCSYNKDRICHAFAINVGGSGPICDAFVSASIKCTGNNGMGGVGACKTKSCKFNDCLMCAAPDIHVQLSGSQAVCSTFKER